jgi:hypothetical protein
MMIEDDLRQRLVFAAEEFPVRGWPVELRRRVARRRRARAGFALAGAVAAAGVAVAVPVVAGWTPGPGRGATPVVASAADYVGSDWLLTDVTEGGRSFAIPPHLGARMVLLPDGQIQIYDSLNGMGGKFTKTADGFEVRDAIMTLIGTDDSSPVRTATIGGMDSLALGTLNRVVSADGTRLVIQTGTFRLTFVRTGPAVTGLPALPAPSDTPS